MPKIKRKKEPAGWELIESTLEQLGKRMREAENDPLLVYGANLGTKTGRDQLGHFPNPPSTHPIYLRNVPRTQSNFKGII